MISNIVKLLQNADPVNRELGFNIAMAQGVGLLNQCIAACGGRLNMSWTTISELPKGLEVSYSLDLRGCTSLLSLPEGLSVGSWIDLCDCASLRSLPEGLSTGGIISLIGCTALQSLPEGISAGGSLYLNGCTSLKTLKIATIKGVAGRIIT